MDPNILSVIIGVAALIAGLIVGKLIFAKNTRKKIEEAEPYVNTVTPADEKNQEPIKTKGLETSNPYNLRYESEAAQYQIKGFRIDQMDSLKITLQISHV